MVSSPMDFRSDASEENTVSSKGIRKKVKNSESIALQRYKIDDYNFLDLDKVLDDAFCSIRPVSSDYDTRKEMVKLLNAMAIDIYGDIKDTCPVLEPYGSFVMDMFLAESDLDVSINFGNRTSEPSHGKKLQVLKRFAEKLRSLQGQGHVRNVVSIFGAKVPIVRFVDEGTAVECDLAVESKDGILNSQIIHIISQIDDRFQKLCLLIKQWAKAHKVNSAMHRTLNSVSVVLLVGHHLQTQDPPILPKFSVLFQDGTDAPSVEERTQKFLNWGHGNKESLGRLFVTFFVKLQSVEFLWKQGLCISLLNGLWISKKWKKAHISVEDFLDVSKNVARAVDDKGAQKIYGCINRTVEDLFEFLNGKIDGTQLRDKLFEYQAVVGPPPPPKELNGCSEEERHKKRVCLENGYKAVEGTSHTREEERYENLRGKRKRFGGFERFYEVPRFGINDKPLDDPYRQVPLNGPANGIDLPPPPPPYGRVYHEWSSMLSRNVFL